MKIPSKKITEATIPNLTPGQEYEFMVLSQDKHGDGMFSKTIRVLTQTKQGICAFIPTQMLFYSKLYGTDIPN